MQDFEEGLQTTPHGGFTVEVPEGKGLVATTEGAIMSPLSAGQKIFVRGLKRSLTGQTQGGSRGAVGE